MSKVRHCTKVEYTQKGKALWEGILSVWAHLWAVSPPYLSSPFSLFPAEFSSLAQKIYQRSICRHLSVWDTRKLVHTNVKSTTPTEGQTPIPTSPVTLHSITAKAEPQSWGQTSKRKSPSPRAQRDVTNFPPSWINESELSSRQLQNAHTREFVHTDVTTHM